MTGDRESVKKGPALRPDPVVPARKCTTGVIPRSFYRHDAMTLARELLGCCLVHREDGFTTAGRIVETEAYLQGDPAAHSFRGKTPRTSVLFGPPGHAYVYFVYGMHWCMNVVTGTGGDRGAVLLRALEPVEGIPVMEERRKTQELRLLCSGPARLAQALAITGEFNGSSLLTGPLRILARDRVPEDGTHGAEEIVQTTRVGISKAQDRPYRFYLRVSPHVSRR
ncbi:MAG TPA: DNA-3-methyladenine glycosylase [Methanoregula sp.]|nr:DNA-3-methyladenine glycosylase [Methanoregula sp.]